MNPKYSFAEKFMFPILQGKMDFRGKDISDLRHLFRVMKVKEIQQGVCERYKFTKGKIVDIGMP